MPELIRLAFLFLKSCFLAPLELGAALLPQQPSPAAGPLQLPRLNQSLDHHPDNAALRGNLHPLRFHRGLDGIACGHRSGGNFVYSTSSN